MPFLTNPYFMVPVIQADMYDAWYPNALILLHGDGADAGANIVESGAISRVWTPTASVTTSNIQKKFGATSLRFTGTTSYVSTPDATGLSCTTGDFTIEAWVWCTSVTSVARIVAQKTTGMTNMPWGLQINASGCVRGVSYNASNTLDIDINGNTPLTAGAWNHVAFVREGSQFRIYANGILQTTTGTSAAARVGNAGVVVLGADTTGLYPLAQGGNAFIDDFRLTVGIARYTGNFDLPTAPFIDFERPDDPYLSSVVSHLHLAGPNGATVTPDIAGNKVYAAQGNAVIATAGAKFSSALALDGTGDYLQTASGLTDFAFGTGDFTVEAWIKTSTVKEQLILDFYVGGSTGANWQMELNSSGYINWYTGGIAGVGPVATGSTNLRDGIWHHVAVARQGTTHRTFVDGLMVNSATSALDYSNISAGLFAVGAQAGSRNAAYDFNGQISEVRVTKGVARYTANFAPTRLPFPDKDGTADFAFERVVSVMHGDDVENSLVVNDVYPNRVWTNGGGVRMTQANRRGGLSTMVFDGTSVALSTPGGEEWNWGAGDFTIEMWIRPANITAGNRDLFGRYDAVNPSGVCIQQRAAKIHLLVSFNGSTWGIDQVALTDTLVAATWSHVAVMRVAGVFYVFCDGAQVSANSSNLTGGIAFSSSNPTRIGINASNANLFVGQMDEFRATRAARYPTAGFVPPQDTVWPSLMGTPDPYVANNVLHLHGDGADTGTVFLDSSPYNRVATRGGTGITTSRTQAKWGGTSIANSAAAGSYLQYPNSLDFDFGAGDFTVEAWIYPTAVTGTKIICTNRASSGSDYGFIFYLQAAALAFTCYSGPASALVSGTGGTVLVNTWQHVVAVRQGTFVKLYINGALVYTSTNISTTPIIATTFPLYIMYDPSTASREFPGYLEELRITKGVCRYTGEFAVPYAPFADRDGVTDVFYRNVGTLVHMENGVVDQKAGKTWTMAGTAAVSGTQKRFGNQSLYLPGGLANYVDSGVSGDNNFGTGDFTIEYWLYTDITLNSGVARMHIDQRPFGTPSGAHLVLYQSGGSNTMQVYQGGSNRITANVLKTLTWQHIAVARYNGTLRLFVDGIVVGTYADATNYVATTLRLGQQSAAAVDQGLNGYIDELRVTKGIARYVDNFMPPVAALPGGSEVGTKRIDMVFEGANGATVFPDAGTGQGQWMVGSGATLTTSSPIEGASSLSLASGGLAYITAAANLGNILPPNENFSLKWKARATSWLRPDTAGAYIVSLAGAAGTAADSIFAVATNSSGYPAFVYSDGTTRSVATGSAPLPTSSSGFVDFEFRRTGTALALYVNGAVMVSATLAANYAFNQITSSPWRIGCNAGATGAPTNGMVFDAFSLSVG